MTKITRAAWKSRLKTNVFNIALDDNHIFGDSAKNEHTKIFEEKKHTYKSYNESDSRRNLLENKAKKIYCAFYRSRKELLVITSSFLCTLPCNNNIHYYYSTVWGKKGASEDESSSVRLNISNYDFTHSSFTTISLSIVSPLSTAACVAYRRFLCLLIKWWGEKNGTDETNRARKTITNWLRNWSCG